MGHFALATVVKNTIIRWIIDNPLVALSANVHGRRTAAVQINGKFTV
jgi:hypothetical protein